MTLEDEVLDRHTVRERAAQIRELHDPEAELVEAVLLLAQVVVELPGWLGKSR